MAELWAGGPKFENSKSAFPLTADSILLADFAAGVKTRRALDIGCGSGIISLLLAWNNPEMSITAVDISPGAVSCARENIRRNALQHRVEIICIDINELEMPTEKYGLVVSNPPYYKVGSGKRSSAQREESDLTLAQLASVSAKALKYGGLLCMVHDAERLADIFEVLRVEGLEPKRIRFISHDEKAAPRRVLIEARLGGKPPLQILPTLPLKNENGGDSDEIKRIYRIK